MSRLRIAIWLAVAVAIVASGALGACGTLLSERGPEPRQDRILFPHQKHIDAEVECLTCHFEIYMSGALGENYRPAEEVCMQCHSEEKENGNCGMCHEDVEHAGAYPPRNIHINLSHEKHIERVEEDCTRCHEQLPEPNLSSTITPPMQKCLDCHNHQEDFDAGRCELCHQDLSRYRRRPESIFSHSDNWVRTHRLSARSSSETCARCHDQSFCSDCHSETVATRISLQWPDRVDRDFIHRNDWLSRHPIEAQEGNLLCTRCHGESFCEDCHRSQGLVPGGPGTRRPHPVGWVQPTSAQFHGREARRDITRCYVCHDQGAQSICVDCHSVGGIGGDPHPAGWTRRHDRQEMADNAMCLYCHM